MVTACQRLLDAKCEQPITTVDVLPKTAASRRLKRSLGKTPANFSCYLDSPPLLNGKKRRKSQCSTRRLQLASFRKTIEQNAEGNPIGFCARSDAILRRGFGPRRLLQ